MITDALGYGGRARSYFGAVGASRSSLILLCIALAIVLIALFGSKSVKVAAIVYTLLP